MTSFISRQLDRVAFGMLRLSSGLRSSYKTTHTCINPAWKFVSVYDSRIKRIDSYYKCANDTCYWVE